MAPAKVFLGILPFYPSVSFQKCSTLIFTDMLQKEKWTKLWNLPKSNTLAKKKKRAAQYSEAFSLSVILKVPIIMSLCTAHVLT